MAHRAVELDFYLLADCPVYDFDLTAVLALSVFVNVICTNEVGIVSTAVLAVSVKIPYAIYALGRIFKATIANTVIVEFVYVVFLFAAILANAVYILVVGALCGIVRHVAFALLVDALAVIVVFVVVPDFTAIFANTLGVPLVIFADKIGIFSSAPFTNAAIVVFVRSALCLIGSSAFSTNTVIVPLVFASSITSDGCQKNTQRHSNKQHHCNDFFHRIPPKLKFFCIFKFFI